VVITEVFLSGSEPAVCEAHSGAVEQIQRWWDRMWNWFRR
jgi:predicted transcriptional regulator YdeE